MASHRITVNTVIFFFGYNKDSSCALNFYEVSIWSKIGEMKEVLL